MKVSKRVIATLIVIGIVVSIAYYWYTLQQLNVVFTWIEWSPEILREGVNAEFRVRVENWVAFPRSYTLPIYLEKWGGSRVKVSTITISLGPGEKKLITFNITFKEPGFYKLIIGEGDLHLHQLLYVSPLNRTNVFRFAVFGDNRPKDNVMPQPGTFKELIREGNMLHNIPILDGDYIYIPSSVNKEVYILGAVETPWHFLYKESMTLMQVITFARGFTPDAKKEVLVIRGGMTHPRVFKIDTNKILAGDERDFPLRPNDIIYVPDSAISTWNNLLDKIMPSLEAVQSGWMLNEIYQQIDGN